MSTNPRPQSVTIVAYVYIAVGAVAFISNFKDLMVARPFAQDLLLAEATELVAFVSGVFLLKGRNWARWAAAAWMVFHVALSALHDRAEMAVHLLFGALTVWALFRRPAAAYFRQSPAG